MTLDISRRARLAIAIALAGLATGALAQGAADLQRVEINAQKAAAAPRLDVRANCPGIDAALPLALANVWKYGPATGVVDVQFELRGDEVQVLSTRGGPRDYHPSVRRAVRGLNCATATAEPKRFAFQIVFRDEPADQRSSGRQTVALLQIQ